VVEVLALEVDLGAAESVGEVAREVQTAGPTHELAQVQVEFRHEGGSLRASS
jgi:hypothetical protein